MPHCTQRVSIIKLYTHTAARGSLRPPRPPKTFPKLFFSATHPGKGRSVSLCNSGVEDGLGLEVSSGRWECRSRTMLHSPGRRRRAGRLWLAPAPPRESGASPVRPRKPQRPGFCYATFRVTCPANAASPKPFQKLVFDDAGLQHSGFCFLVYINEPPGCTTPRVLPA